MAQQSYETYFSNESNLVSLCEKVHVILADSSASLVSILENLEETIIEHDIKLLVVDSGASPLRKVWGTSCEG